MIMICITVSQDLLSSSMSYEKRNELSYRLQIRDSGLIRGECLPNTCIHLHMPTLTCIHLRSPVLTHRQSLNIYLVNTCTDRIKYVCTFLLKLLPTLFWNPLSFVTLSQCDDMAMWRYCQIIVLINCCLLTDSYIHVSRLADYALSFIHIYHHTKHQQLPCSRIYTPRLILADYFICNLQTIGRRQSIWGWKWKAENREATAWDS